MLLGLLTLITALSISAVAIYYSVAGLVAIFAAAALPIMIMGGVLEVSKLVTAVWLHRYWKQATWWLKGYLSIAVVVLMLITSMGIFGFLSKAHIEQTSASTESVARAEVLQKEIDRQIAIVGRAENEIRKLESTGTGSDANIQTQINAEQERIDKAYERVQPAIDEQQRIIDSQGKLFQDELARVDTALAQLQSYIDAGDIKRAQQMVGAKADGAFGPNTAAKFREWQDARQQDRAALLTKIEQATNNPQARAAAEEIKRLRTTVETQIADSNRLISRLRQNIGKTDNSSQIQTSIDDQNARIQTASSEIDTLTQEKIQVESEYRKLEAEVGPIKYIAEFVYGEQADKNMLEKAVTWVIVIIIFVFDPLAVLLLIASQYTFEYHRKQTDEEEMPSDEWELYERARAQAIVDNPGYNVDDPKEEANEDHRREDREETEQVDASLPKAQPIEAVEAQAEADPVVVAEEENLTPEQMAEPYVNVEPEPQKKSIESSEELRLTEEQLDELDKHPLWNDAKQRWKDDHPDETLKEYKLKYLHGIINKLPWEDYLAEPETHAATEQTGYIQNQEQNENSIWKRIGDK